MTTATTFSELAVEAQKQALASLKQAQDLSLRGAELAAEAVRQAEVPSAKDAVESAFAFAGQVLQQNKHYAIRMTEVVTGNAEPAPAKAK